MLIVRLIDFGPGPNCSRNLANSPVNKLDYLDPYSITAAESRPSPLHGPLQANLPNLATVCFRPRGHCSYYSIVLTRINADPTAAAAVDCVRPP